MQEDRAGANGADAPARCADTMGSCCCRLRGRACPSTSARRPIASRRSSCTTPAGRSRPSRRLRRGPRLGLCRILQSRMIAGGVLDHRTGDRGGITRPSCPEDPRLAAVHRAAGARRAGAQRGGRWWRARATATAGVEAAAHGVVVAALEQSSPHRLALAARERERFRNRRVSRPGVPSPSDDRDAHLDLGARPAAKHSSAVYT